MLKQRILTALVLLPVVLAGFFLLGGAGFALFTGLITVLGAWEWARLSGWQASVARVAYAALVAVLLWLVWRLQGLTALAPGLLVAAAFWWLVAAALVVTYPASARWLKSGLARAAMGLLILVPTWQGLILLKAWPLANLMILSVLLLVWAADIGAYFVGRAWGRHKLAPSVSPGKSWEGFAGGLLASILVAVVLGFSQDWQGLQVLPVVLGAALVVVVSVLGDLTESLFKREAGLKDSSQLLPGHGGILDRIDSLTAAVPLYVLLLWLCGWGAR